MSGLAKHRKETLAETGAILKTTQKWRSGSRYEGRSGYRSLMDEAKHIKDAKDYDDKYGGDGQGNRGVYALQVRTPDNKAHAPHATINIGGRRFKADNEGNLRILDADYIKEEVASTVAQKEYEESIVEAILVSDAMAKHVLGNDVFDKLKSDAGVDQLSTTLKKVDATPDVIRYYDPTSTTYAQAIAKIRATVHLTGIIVNEESSNLPKPGTLAHGTKGSSQDKIQ